MSIVALVLGVIGAIIIVASSLLLLGALFPRIPHLGVHGSLAWPTLIGPATIFVTVGLLLELGAFWITGHRLALALAVLGGLAMLGTLVILADQVTAAIRAGVPVRPRALIAVGPGPKLPPDDSVTYTTGPDGEPLRMVVYRSRHEAPDGAPIVVCIHGGGWYQGAPDEHPAILRWFADEGYLVFAPAYTLATESRSTWDIAMPQVATALIWVAEHAHHYGGDPGRIAVWGASAGANLALAAAYAGAAGKLPDSVVGSFPHVAAVAGEVPAVDPALVHDNRDPTWGPRTREMVARYIGGAVDEYPERLAAVRVETYLSAQAPPTLLTVSKGDHLVPVEGVRQFVDKARAASVNIRAVYRPWGDHLSAAIYDGFIAQTMLRLMRDHFRRNGV